MQLALYRSERPEVFEDIIGQKHIVRILQNQIRTGTVSQAYLFSGTHGTGKTSTARILAKAVNCLEGEPGTPSAVLSNGPASGLSEAAGEQLREAGNQFDSPDATRTIPCGHCVNCESIREGRFVDCIELDAASNNGVDDLRAIIDMVKYPPTVGRYKVYIIDEVHMLSQAAENAFLKTLEEPPAHAIFILATTDPQKVRSTIRSRCMQLNFKRVTESELAAGMERICAKRGIEVTQDALITIASRADGSVRDALSILEQCIAAGDKRLDRNLVLEYTGAAGEDFFLALTGAVAAGDTGKALVYIDEIIRRGKDAKQILKDWLMHYRNLMVVKYVAKPGRIIGSSAENAARLKAQADSIDISDIETAIRLISEYINIGRYSERPRILLETAAVRLAGGLAGAPAGYQPGIAVAGRQGGSASRVSATGTSSPGGASGPVSGSASNRNSASLSNDRQGGAPAGTAGPRIDPSGSGNAAASSVQDSDPIFSITPAPREQIGSPDVMWNTIVDTVARNERSFASLVGRYSRGTEFESGELKVVVKPGKIKHAEDKLGDITRIARGLYGQDVIVTLRAGDPDAPDDSNASASEQETSRIIDEDAAVNEAASDIENLFGIRPEITN